MNHDIVELYQDPNDLGSTVTIGPGCFAATDRSVINWDGVNYVPQPQIDVIVFSNEGKIDLKAEADKLIKRIRQEERDKLVDVDTVLGFNVNDFQSEVRYAIFNDPEADDIRDLPEQIKPRLVDNPLYEDDTLARVAQHLRLMNEDRAALTPPRGPAKLRQQTVLKTPWTDVTPEEV